jgi:hypothetical protein
MTELDADSAQNFQYASLWENNKSPHFKNLLGQPLTKPSDLFTSEADIRSYWFFHYSNFELGSLLIFCDCIILLVKALWEVASQKFCITGF